MNRRNLRFPGFKLRALTLSYDDGSLHDKRLIEIMLKYGLKGTFNINSGLFDPNGKWHMSLEESKELYLSSGMEVAVHGYRHTYLTDVDSARATYEIIKDREELEKHFGGIIKGMAYAYGDYNDNVVQILKDCGIKYSRTTISTEDFYIPQDFLRMPTTCHHNNPKLFKLVEDFFAPEDEMYYKRTPRLFYLWGHSFEFDRNNNWNVIEEFAKKVGGRDDVWYATNMEIYDYVNAYDKLEYSLDGKTVYNPSSIDVYLNYYGDSVIRAGKTVTFKE